MISTTAKADVKTQVEAWKRAGKSIGLVPTMGYLHEGHRSLIERAAAENDHAVVSVFVNPTQFAPEEDLQSYPRDIDADAALCRDAGAALLFHPAPEEMYAPDFCTFVDMDAVSKGLCGASRPTHFRGVCTVVAKLMNLARADRAYFGQKDAQQLAVVRRMVRDLDMNVDVVGCPIVREPDGLAKSSRNTYLSPDQRAAAVVLSRAIEQGRRLVDAGETDAKRVLGAMRAAIEKQPLARIDYLEAVSWDSIEPVETLEGPTLVAMAVFIGSTRLIDNFIIER